MKHLIFIIALVFTFSASPPIQATNNTPDHEAIFSIDDIGSHDFIMQNQQDITNQIGNHDNSQGYNLYQITGDRHFTSATSCRYCENIHANKGAKQYTNINKEQAGNSIITTSWRPDRSRMHLRRIEAGSQNLQRNYSYAKRNDNPTKGDHYFIAKQDTNLSPTIPLDWNSSGNRDCRVSCNAIYKTKSATILSRYYLL